MKLLLTLVTLTALTAGAMGDIHDPPMNDYGPSRKLGRGLANLVFGVTELSQQPAEINSREGNAAAWTYGVVRGVGRFAARVGYGVYEIATFPIPSVKGSYRVPYKQTPPWINGGMEEFPPELGFNSRYRYTRSYYGW